MGVWWGSRRPSWLSLVRPYQTKIFIDFIADNGYGTRLGTAQQMLAFIECIAEHGSIYWKIPPPPRGEIMGEKIRKGEEKKWENVKEKGRKGKEKERKGKENEKRRSKRVKKTCQIGKN
jgi:hypothetical protein